MTRRLSAMHAVDRGKRQVRSTERDERDRRTRKARSDTADDDLLSAAGEEAEETHFLSAQRQNQNGKQKTKREQRETLRFSDVPILPTVFDFRLEFCEDRTRYRLILITDKERTDELEEAAREALRPWLPTTPVVVEGGRVPADAARAASRRKRERADAS